MQLSLIQTLIYSFALWQGCYLLARNWPKPGMRYTGLGLISYAVGLVALSAPEVVRLVAVAPLLLWSFAGWHLLRAQENLPARLWRLVVIFAICFFLSAGLVLLPGSFLTSDFALVAMGVDLLLLGAAIAALDAYDEGEVLLPDALRSLAGAALGVLVFGGQVVMVMVADEDHGAALQILLLTITASVILLTVFGGRVRTLLDTVVFARDPALQAERARLQAVTDALPRSDESHDLLAMDEAQFTRLTRRALGNMGRLDRLVTSPLTRLPLVDAALNSSSPGVQSLERATILQSILTSSIERLKPGLSSDRAVDQTAEAWRHYNVLHYPYVRGIKPLSRRLVLAEYDAETRMVLEWFRAQVPERTFHNWQNAAAKLVAQDLREQMMNTHPANWAQAGPR